MPIESPYRLSLSEPTYLILEANGKEVKLDVFVAQRLLAEADKQPSQELRWKMVGKYLAEALEVPVGSIAESQSIEFNQVTIRLYDQAWETIAKKVKGIASWQQPTAGESQETIPLGKTG